MGLTLHVPAQLRSIFLWCLTASFSIHTFEFAFHNALVWAHVFALFNGIFAERLQRLLSRKSKATLLKRGRQHIASTTKKKASKQGRLSCSSLSLCLSLLSPSRRTMSTTEAAPSTDEPTPESATTTLLVVEEQVVTKPGSYIGALKSKAVVTEIVEFCAEDALSATASHDRTDTQSVLTHQESASVVSSWVDDDDYFMTAAMQDISFTSSTILSPPSVAVPTERTPQGKGWKVAQSGRPSRSGAHQQQHRNRRGGNGTQTTPFNPSQAGHPLATPTTGISGGRFDALASECKRRW